MKQIELSGCHLPIITPFTEDYKLDESGLRQLVNYYIEDIGVNGIVPCGTTGESPTLSSQEHDKVIEIVVEETAGRVPVIAGTGSNSTEEAIQRTKHAEKVGADASLQVGPYYNKPTQAGLIKHFQAIAETTTLPLLIYNIPGRTGRNIEPETIIKLAEIDNIVGLKDCSGNVNQTMAIIKAARQSKKKFYVLSGDDAATYINLALGGDGAIAASAHLVGKEYVEMCRLAFSNQYQKAREIHYRTLPLVKSLFIETNPAPVKEALKMMNLPAGPVRLPLVPLQEKNRQLLRKALKEAGKIN
jgi:4-hydroxy-tetrahydrodipicolinate synthase